MDLLVPGKHVRDREREKAPKDLRQGLILAAALADEDSAVLLAAFEDVPKAMARAISAIRDRLLAGAEGIPRPASDIEQLSGQSAAISTSMTGQPGVRGFESRQPPHRITFRSPSAREASAAQDVGTP